jgi:arsenate reductase
MPKRNVLFLCTGNSCRSQMAEGLTNHFLGDRYVAYSAGTAPSGDVHPLAIRAMQEIGIDISEGTSKRPEVYRHITFDLVITVCDDAAKTCPVWLREGEVVHIGFDDPALATGTEEERMAVFRRVRDEIREQVLTFLSQFT